MRSITLFVTVLLTCSAYLCQAQNACDSLIINSVHFDPLFADSTIIVMVDNQSSQIYDYPVFQLISGSNDTLATEIVNLFALSATSRHSLIKDMDVSSNTLNGVTLGLYTAPSDSFVCSYSLDVDLCYANCTPISFSIQKTTSDSLSYTFDYTVTDSMNQVVATGQLELADTSVYFTSATACLSPGEYSINYTHTGGTGVSDVYCRVYTPVGNPGSLQVYDQGLNSLEYGFDVMLPCLVAPQDSSIDSTVSVRELYNEHQIEPRWVGQQLALEHATSVLEHVQVFDVNGRLIHQSTPLQKRTTIDLSDAATGVLIVQVRTAEGTETFKTVSSVR